MTDLPIAGVRLEVRLVTPRAVNHPTLVFLHEGLGCAAAWRAFPDDLARQTGCGAVVYSRWGYGASTPRPAPWPSDFLEHEARDVLPAVLDACGVQDAILFGHSDGGTIALLAAAGHHGRVRAVITEAAHVMVEDVTVEGLHGLRQRWDTGDLRAGLQRLHGARADDVFLGWSGIWTDPAFRGWDIRHRLASIRCPVLALQGDRDEYGTAAQLDAIAACAGGPADTWLIPNCGHTPHRDQPAAVQARTVGLIREVVDGRR